MTLAETLINLREKIIAELIRRLEQDGYHRHIVREVVTREFDKEHYGKET